MPTPNIRLGGAGANRPADRDLHGDAQHRAHRRALVRGGLAPRHAGRRHRRRDHAGAAHRHLHASTGLLDDVGELGFGLPGLMVIGDIVAVRERLLQLVAEIGGRAVTARGLIVSAPRSSSGKTTVTLGLLGALRAGRASRCARRNPDRTTSIPAFHAAATGAKGVNLDTWAMPPSLIDALIADADAGRRNAGDRRRDGAVRRRAGRRRAAPARRRIWPRGSACRCCWFSTSRGSRNRRPRSPRALPRTIRRCASAASCSTSSAASGTAR